jgi:hypothetical protein
MLVTLNFATLAKLELFETGLRFSRGILLPHTWIDRDQISDVVLTRGSSEFAIPFVIPLVRFRNGRLFRFQSLRAIRHNHRQSLPEIIVDDLNKWLRNNLPEA